MTTAMEQALIGVCGGGAGAGVYLLWRAARTSKSTLTGDLDALYAAPATASRAWRSQAVSRRLVAFLSQVGLRQILLEEDLAVARRTVEEHTTVRLLHAAAGIVGMFVVWVIAATVTSAGLLTAPLMLMFGAVTGIWWADRHIRHLAESRRKEAHLAIADYLDLVRILLRGGLPLLAAVRAAADDGNGWAFDQLRQGLSWAQDRELPPDEGLRAQGHELGLPDFIDLAATITSARRGASPIQALESKAAFVRGAHSAEVRAEAAVADAQIELPAAVVALGLMSFLTYALMSLISTGTGVQP